MLSKELREQIIQFVKREPCLVQDIAKQIGKSWVATEGYVERISKETGLIKTKAFRKGTRGAVKVVFWNYSESAQSDEIRERLFEKIRLVANKKEFDPLEIFQFSKDKRSAATLEFKSHPSASKKHSIFASLERAHDELLCFSGNLSWIGLKEGKKNIPDLLDSLLQRGVLIKIICRIDIATLNNLRPVEKLMKKHPGKIELRHCLQPLRCFIIDSKIARFKDDKKKGEFKEKELADDLRIFYEIFDIEWVEWLKQVFWYLFRHSVSLEERMAVLEKIGI